MTNQYTLAGWLAIASAVLLIPEIGLAVLLGFISSGLEIYVAPIHIANLCIGLYILYVFRKLLNQEFNFHATDTLITVLILVNIVFFVIGLVDLVSSTTGIELGTQRDLSLITMILFVPFSILTIVFGVKLLRLREDMYGLLRPYAYATIGSGACGATIILAPLGLVAAIAALVILGMIFLRAKREAEIL